MPKYMVHTNWAGSTFVKAKEYFVEQGGEKETWGLHWTEVEAGSIDAARRVGQRIKCPLAGCTLCKP